MLLKPYWKFFHSFYFLKTTEVGYNSFLKFIAMKRIILFCLSFFYSNFIFSQNGYYFIYKNEIPTPVWVRYELRNGTNVEIEKGPLKNHYNHIIFNDSINISFWSLEEKPIFTRTHPEDTLNLEKTFLKTKCFYFEKNSNTYWYRARAKEEDKFFLIKKTPTVYNFILETDSVLKAGFVCEKGYAVNTPGDTVFAVISKDFKDPYGPSMYDGFPGLVFDIIHARNEVSYTLMSITGGNFILRIPDLPRMTLEEFNNKNPK